MIFHRLWAVSKIKSLVFTSHYIKLIQFQEARYRVILLWIALHWTQKAPLQVFWYKQEICGGSAHIHTQHAFKRLTWSTSAYLEGQRSRRIPHFPPRQRYHICYPCHPCSDHRRPNSSADTLRLAKGRSGFLYKIRSSHQYILYINI